jgi:hypothetical protein
MHYEAFFICCWNFIVPGTGTCGGLFDMGQGAPQGISDMGFAKGHRSFKHGLDRT